MQASRYQALPADVRETNRPDLPLGSPGVPSAAAWLLLDAGTTEQHAAGSGPQSLPNAASRQRLNL